MFNLWRNPRIRALAFQAAALLAVFWFGYTLFQNTLANMAQRGISTGFDFWNEPAGFGIIMSLIPYDETMSYGRTFYVGLLNTLLVSALGIVLATLLGFIMGIARLSSNWLVAKLATAYIEIFRNLPLLLQIFFWYFAVLNNLPSPRQSLALGDLFFLNNRGLYLPSPVFGDTFHWDIPVLEGFNFTGGIVLIPELMALLTALTIYTGAFIAEIVRAGILSVSQGQKEAALSLGLRPHQVLRLVIIPQAMRVIIPPLTSQYLNLTKNSSLATAIGYPDLVAVFMGTTLNQTGQAVEIVAITMGVYLTISLTISLLMNLYNRAMALKGLRE